MTRRFALLTAALAMVLFCTACGAKEDPAPPVETDPPAVEQPSEEQAPAAPEQEQAGEETPEQPTDPALEAETLDFAALAGLEFTFSSGAGGWRTVLEIDADGTFRGLYTDSEMGDVGEDYPNGTYYISEFSGRFDAPVREDEYTWLMTVAELNYAHPMGEEIEEGCRYVYTKANGIAGAEGLFVVAPGTPLAVLPEFYLNWAGYYELTQTTDTELPFWGLYDTVSESGFVSYAPPTAAELVQQEVEWAAAAAAGLEAQLQNAQTQLDMNMLSGDLYKVWDTTLNTVWNLLRQELDGETMQQLTAQQLAWIEEKEAAMTAAGAAYEGGSIHAMVVNTEAAEWTQQRVYELAAYLK